MSQDSSDEESEEEEDFTRVQFGSRYTAAQRVCVHARSVMGPLYASQCPGGLPLTMCKQARVDWGERLREV